MAASVFSTDCGAEKVPPWANLSSRGHVPLPGYPPLGPRCQWPPRKACSDKASHHRMFGIRPWLGGRRVRAPRPECRFFVRWLLQDSHPAADKVVGSNFCRPVGASANPLTPQGGSTCKASYFARWAGHRNCAPHLCSLYELPDAPFYFRPPFSVRGDLMLEEVQVQSVLSPNT
jgi:hypothetical protein